MNNFKFYWIFPLLCPKLFAWIFIMLYNNEPLVCIKRAAQPIVTCSALLNKKLIEWTYSNNILAKKSKMYRKFLPKINSSREKRNPFEPFFLAVRGATPLFKKSKHIKSPGDNLQAANICANRQLYRHAECRRFLQLRIRGRSIVYTVPNVQYSN